MIQTTLNSTPDLQHWEDLQIPLKGQMRSLQLCYLLKLNYGLGQDYKKVSHYADGGLDSTPDLQH